MTGLNTVEDRLSGSLAPVCLPGKQEGVESALPLPCCDTNFWEFFEFDSEWPVSFRNSTGLAFLVASSCQLSFK